VTDLVCGNVNGTVPPMLGFKDDALHIGFNRGWQGDETDPPQPVVEVVRFASLPLVGVVSRSKDGFHELW
jgi:hypothetical protein